MQVNRGSRCSSATFRVRLRLDEDAGFKERQERLARRECQMRLDCPQERTSVLHASCWRPSPTASAMQTP